MLVSHAFNSSTLIAHSLGLLERENACVLNAALVGVAARVTAGLTDAMSANGIAAEAYIAQNDGTLMAPREFGQYPVLTFASGPTNSMRGAAFLSARNDVQSAREQLALLDSYVASKSDGQAFASTKGLSASTVGSRRSSSHKFETSL